MAGAKSTLRRETKGVSAYGVKLGLGFQDADDDVT